MSKKAILVGVNYLKSNKYRLSSPINDINIMRDFLVNYCNYQTEDIIMLSDSPKVEKSASFFNITKELKECNELDEDDFLFIFMSGHGSTIMDINGDESDDKDELFLPQDWEINKITDDLMKTILKDLKCRTFIMFDCCNSGTMCDLKYTYDIKNLELRNNLKTEDMKNDIICLSSSGENKNTFEKFVEKNLINNDKNKFYGELTIFFLQLMKNYLETNLTFVELTYESLLTYLNEYLFEMNQKDIDKKTVNYRLKHNILKNLNLKPFMSASNKTVIKNKFLYNLTDDKNEEREELNIVNVLKRKTVSSLSYKYLRLKRKTDYLEKINKNLVERNNKLLSVISGKLNYNFGMLNR